MNITDELYKVRHRLMEESIRQCGLNQDQIDHWIRIDDAFRGVVVKKIPADCKKRYNTDEILDFPDPGSREKRSA